MNIAIITGASGGLGRWFSYYANIFATDIDEIWLIGRNKQKLLRVSEKLPVACRIIVADLTNPMEDYKFNQLLLRLRPGIRLLVNNAGCGMIGSFAEVGIHEHMEILNLNCAALTRITHYCLPYMSSQSHIINVASAAAFFPQADFAVYAASKSYVLRLSLALSRELKKRGIIVTAVCPGSIKTGFFKHAEKYQKRKAYKNLFMYQDRKVVLKAYQDAYKNKRISIIGILMKLLAAASKISPFHY